MTVVVGGEQEGGHHRRLVPTFGPDGIKCSASGGNRVSSGPENTFRHDERLAGEVLLGTPANQSS